MADDQWTQAELEALPTKQDYDPSKAPVWEQVSDHFTEAFPELPREYLKSEFEKMRNLHQARWQVAKELPDEPTGLYLARNISFAGNTLQAVRAGQAQQRIDSGQADQQDYLDVAYKERLDQFAQQQNETLGGQLSGAALRAPEFLAQAATGGAILGATKIGAVGLPAAGMGGMTAASAGKTILGGAARSAIQGALTPAMWVERAVQNNTAAGRDPLSPLGVPEAVGHAAATMAVLNLAGEASAGLLPGEGMAKAIGRIALSGAQGPFTQAAVDVTSYGLGLNSGYGNLEKLIKGDVGGALKGAAVDAFSYAAFRGMHEAMDYKPFVKHVADTLKTMKEEGVPADEAGRKVSAAIEVMRARPLVEIQMEPGYKYAIGERGQLAPSEQPNLPEGLGQTPPGSQPGGRVRGYGQEIPVEGPEGIASPAVRGTYEVQARPELFQEAQAARRRGEFRSTPESDAELFSTILESFDEIQRQTSQGRSAASSEQIVQAGIKDGQSRRKPRTRAKPVPSSPEPTPGAETGTEQPPGGVYGTAGAAGEQVGAEQGPIVARGVETAPEAKPGPSADQITEWRATLRALGYSNRDLKSDETVQKLASSMKLSEFKPKDEVINAATEAKRAGINQPVIEEVTRSGEEVGVQEADETNRAHEEGRGQLTAGEYDRYLTLTNLESAYEQRNKQLPEKQRAELAALNDKLGLPSGKLPGGVGMAGKRGRITEEGMAKRAGLRETTVPPAADIAAEREPTPEDFGKPVTAAEQRTLPGGGQPNAEELVRAKKVTALANAITDSEREARGMTPILRQARSADPEVWDRAMAKIDADPEAGAKLVTELAKKTRSTTDEENALLLQRKVALSNEHTRAMLDYIAAFKGKADAITLDQLEAREAKLKDLRDEIDKVIVDTGSEWGKSGRWRRILAAEDYTLSGMLLQAESAKGKPLTPEEKIKLDQQQQAIAKTQEVLAQAEETLARQNQGVKSPGYRDWVEANVAASEAKGVFQRDLNSARRSRMSSYQRLLDWLQKARVNEVISGPKTLGKIAAASLERIAIAPGEEIAGAVLSRTPGLTKLAALAPRQGRGLKPQAETEAVKSAFTEGVKDAWRRLSTGQTELEAIHEPLTANRTWLDLQFSLHGALKDPAQRNEYTRSFLHRLDAEAAAGRDATSPASLMRQSALAFKDSKAAKFQQDNWLVDKIKSFLTPGSKAGVGERTALAAGKLLLPVVRIPTNLAFETATYAFGLPTGAARAAYAQLFTGLKNVKAAEADAIMRQLKKGSLGAAALAIGYALPGTFGGYYTPKREESDVKTGAIRIGGVNVPSWLLHNPFLEVFQLGATIRRASDKQYKGSPQGLTEGAIEGLLGLSDEIPLMREMKEAGGLTSHNARERGWKFGQLAKSFAAPQFFQWIAGLTDQDPNTGEPVKRKPETVWQHIETGYPVLRKNVK